MVSDFMCNVHNTGRCVLKDMFLRRKTYQKDKKKWHLKPRVFKMLFVLMIVVFGSVFLVFHFYFRYYIQLRISTQLDQVVKVIEVMDEQSIGQGVEDADNGPYGEDRLPKLSDFANSNITTEAHVFNLDINYDVTDVDKKDNQEKAEDIAYELKEQKASLTETSNKFIVTKTGKYYVSSITDPMISNLYMVFYIDVSDLLFLDKILSAALAGILAIAMLVCLFVANVIAGTVVKPVKKLSDFAQNLGHGKFEPQLFEFQDIELNELAKAMNRAAIRLDDTDKEQKKFFQNISHELRTPLMSIKCYAEGLSCGLMDSKKSAEIILTETDRLSELVEDLLYISKADAHVLKIERKEGDLRETVSMAIEGIQPLAAKEKIKLIYDFDDDEVMYGYQENYIYRAVTNLLSNAIRYAASEVMITCRKETNQVIIGVQDDGDSISEEDFPHIFERFYKGKSGKNGIGLSIVKSIVELHEGKVEVLNKNGVSFVLRFPTFKV